jgi:hypothetical protein
MNIKMMSVEAPAMSALARLGKDHLACCFGGHGLARDSSTNPGTGIPRTMSGLGDPFNQRLLDLPVAILLDQ